MIPTVCLGLTNVLPPPILNNIHNLRVQRVVLGNVQYLSQDKAKEMKILVALLFG